MKISNLLSKIFEKKSLVMAFVFLCAVWISTPTPTTAQYTKSPAELQRFSVSTYEDCVNRGRIPASVDKELVGNCVDGEYATMWNTIGTIFGGLPYMEYIVAASEGDLASSLDKLNETRTAGGYGGGLDMAVMDTTDTILGQRPISGLAFTQEVVANTVTPGQVYADDIQAYFPGWGFDLLSPIRTLWGYFVGIAYSLMIFLVLIIAFALMFRANLGGEQAVQLQSAIPGIVLAMILIPLSYPISGLFIDGITLGTNITRNFLIGSGGVFEEVYLSDENGLKFANPSFIGEGQTTTADNQDDPQDNRGLFPDDPRLGIWKVQSMLGIGQGGGFAPVRSSLCQFIYGDSEDSACNANLPDMLSLGLIDFFKTSVGAFLSALVAAFVFTVVKVIFLATSFRIGWQLFLQFITLLMLPAFSPLIFATLALPGQGNKAVIWYLKRLGNVTANFVAAYGLILLSIIFSAASFTNLVPTFTNADGEEELRQYEPPLLSGTLGFGQAVGLANQGQSGAVDVVTPSLFYVVGLGLFVLTPGILQRITDQIAPREENPFMKFATEEIGKTRDLAFRQAPAVLGAPIRGAAQGIVNARSSFMNDKKNALDESLADKQINNARDRYNKRQGEIEADKNSSNPFRKYVSANVRRGVDRVATSIDRANAASFGREKDLRPKEGEEGGNFTFSFQFPGLSPNSSDDFNGSTSFTASLATLSKGTFVGNLIVYSPSGASAPQGPVAIATAKDSTYILAYLTNGSKTEEALFIDPKEVAKQENKFVITKYSIQLGKNFTIIPVSLKINASLLAGSATGLTFAKNVAVAIGDIKKETNINIRIT